MLENSFGELLFTGEVFPSDCTIAVSFSKSAHCAPFPLQSYVFHLAIAQANLRHSHAFVLTYATLLGFALGQLGPFPAGYYALCPAYSVTNTNSDTQNYATCWMYLYYGVTYTISMCSYGSGSGDTYIRLYDSTNTVLLASNDDSCGLVSAMTYTTPGCGATAQNYALYYLHSGCYSSTSCSGTVAVIGSSGTPCSPTPSNTPTISVTPSYTATTSATATVTATVTLTPSPSVSPTNPPSYFIGPQGSSCADTCANYGLTCNPNIVTGNSPAIFAQLGVSCTADPTSYWAPYQPAYVSDSGNANYTKCQGYTNVPSPASCTASNPSVKRLCQCYPGGHCPAGWTLYADDGTEGGSSCVLATSTNVYWSTAITGCPSGSHLLTLKTSNPAGTFPTFLKTLVSFSSMRYWLGGSQAYGQPYRNVGWSWIDGTNPANLNCGAGNAIGCNLWYAPDPDDGGFSNEADREDYLQSNLNVGGSFSVNDIAAASTPSALLCEYDLPGYGYNRSAQIGNEVFLRGVYLEVGFHSKGSFGTTNLAPIGFNGAFSALYQWSGVGMIADYGRDGIVTGTPPYGGDYLISGAMVEGWSVAFTELSTSIYVNKGLTTSVYPSAVTTGAWDISTTSMLGAVWLGTAGNMKVSMVSTFGVNDLAIIATVTLKNTGPYNMTAVDYMRNINPNPEQPWTNNLATNNYVMYQLFQTGDSALRSNPTQPNTCLVEASSSSYPSVILGLGTVSSNCRVTHFGSQNDVSTIAWTDPTWTSYSSVSPNNADVGLNMIQRFPRLGPGASVTFSWMYGYTQADMTTALNAISSVIIQQPVDTVSGSSATFSAMVTGTVSIVYFYVTFNKTTYSLVGTSTTPSPSVSSGGGLYSIPFNSLAFPSQDGYVFRVVATISGVNVTSSKVIKIDNSGPSISLSVSPVLGSGFLIDTLYSYTLTATYLSGPSVTNVSFYLDQTQLSSYLGSATTSPFKVTFSVPALGVSLSINAPVSLRAVATTSSGGQQVTILSGLVNTPDVPASSISLAAITTNSYGPAVAETASPGQIVGVLSSISTATGDTFAYTVTTPGSSFIAVGSALVVAPNATFSYYVQNSYTFNITSTTQTGLNYSTSMTVYINHVNLPPTAIALSSTVLPENSAVNSLLGLFAVTDRDSNTFGMQLTNTGGGSFYSSGMNVYVAKALSYNAAPVVTITALATDSNGLSLSSNFVINVTWVNKPPTAVSITANKVLELLPPPVTVGTLATTDPDPWQTFTYTMVDNANGQFAISGSNLVTAATLNYLAGSAISVSIQTTDSGTPPPGTSYPAMASLSFTQVFTITVQQNPQPPAVSNTVMSIYENALFGSIVGGITLAQGAYAIPLNFSINTTTSDPSVYTLSTTRGCYVLQPAYSFFRVQECSGTIFTNTSCLNYEVRNYYDFNVTVVGLLATTVSVVVNVLNVNEPPVPSNVNVSINEHSAAGMIVVTSIPSNDPDYNSTAFYAFTGGNTGGMFAIDNSTGQITLALSTLDYQNLPVGQKYFSLSVSVFDGQLYGYCTVTVNVNNIPEAPHVTTCTNMAINENSPTGTQIAYPVIAFDEDGNNLFFTVLSGADNNIFHVIAFNFSTPFSAGGASTDRANVSVAQGMVNGTWLIDYETTPGFAYPLVVLATDAVNQSASFSCPITINDVNEAPWSPPSVTLYIAEDTPAGTQLFMANGTGTLYVWDQDFVDFHTWSVVSWGPQASSFFSLSSAGNITTLLTPVYALQSVYTFVVQVADKGGLTSRTTVTVMVLDIPEAPVIAAADARTLAENQPIGSDIRLGAFRVDICATDDHGTQNVTYSLSPLTSGFALSSVISVTGALCARITSTIVFNYETMVSPVVPLNVTACAAPYPSLCSTDLLTVTITEVDEPPVLNNTFIAISANAAAGTLVGPPLVCVDHDPSDTNTFFLNTNTSVFKLTQLSNTLAQLSVSPSLFGLLGDIGPTWFLLNVSVVDRSLLYTNATVNISLIVQAAPPVVYPANFSVQESVPAVPAGSTVGTVVGKVYSFDRQNYSVALSILSGDPQGQFAINPTTGVLTVAQATISYNSVKLYALTIQAMDFPPNVTSTQYGTATVYLNVTHVNHPPTLPTPPVVSIAENAAVGALVGLPVQGSDVDISCCGDVLTYSLLSYTNVFTIAPGTGQITVSQSGVLNYVLQSTYAIGVKVTDAGGLTATTTLTLNLILVPTPPTLSSQNRSVVEYASVGTVVGSPLSVYDRDSSSFRFAIASITAYTIVSTGTDASGNETFVYSIGPAASPVFSIDNSGVISVAQAVLQFETVPIYLLSVSVTDSYSLSATANIFVNLIDVNVAPVFNVSTLAAKSIYENATVGTWIPPPIIASDEDWGQVITYSLAAGQSLFGISPINGTLYLAQGGVLNFEGVNVYVVTVIATDSGAPQNPGYPLSVSATVTVNVLEVNKPPVALYAGAVYSIQEDCCNTQPNNIYSVAPGSVIATVPVSDPDPWDAGLLRTTFSNLSYTQFALNASTQILTVLAPLNFEAIPSYSFNVTVTDHLGLTAWGTITVNVIDINEVPFIFNSTRNISENPAKGLAVGDPIYAYDVDYGQYLTYTFAAGNAAGLFFINPCSGLITVLNPSLNSRGMSTTLDYEVLNTFNFTVEVTDDGVPPLSMNASLTITLNDINEPPFITPQTFSVPENSPVGTLVGTPISNTLYDEDFVDFHTYGITGGNALGYFTINTTSGQLSVAVNALDFESNNLYSLTVTVWDKGNLTDSEVYTVNIINVNEPPVLIGSQIRTINENSLVGMALNGLALSYWDPENDTVALWNITGGTNASLWAVSSPSGVFTVAQAYLSVAQQYNVYTLDYEQNAAYTLTLMLTDHGRLPQANGTVFYTTPANGSGYAFEIDLLDVLEPPYPPNVTFAVPENYFFASNPTGPFNTVIGSLFVYCEDFVKALSYGITGGGPFGTFGLVDVGGGNGTVNTTLLGLVDFETQPQYVLTYAVAHSTITKYGTITVNLTDVNEAPFYGASQQVPNSTFSMVVKELSGVGTLLNRTDNVSLHSVLALDVDAADKVLSYAIVAGDSTHFAINSSTAVLSVSSAGVPSFQLSTSYWMLVCATDHGGLKAYANVTVNAIQINKPPFFTTTPSNLGVGRDSADGTIVTTLAGADYMSNPFTFNVTSQSSPGLFGVGASGAVIVTGTSTLLQIGNSYWVVVKLFQTAAADGSALQSSVPLNFTITVTPQDFPPKLLTPASYNVLENSTVGTPIGAIPFFDADNATVQFSFNVSCPQYVAVSYTASNLSAVLIVNALYDYATLPQFSVTVTISDNYAYGALSASSTFVVYVIEINKPPSIAMSQFVVADGMSSLRVAENATGVLFAGAVVGDVVVADENSPSEAWGQETFYLSSAIPAQPFPFTIQPVSGDPRRGRVFLTAAGPLQPNFEQIPTYYGNLTVVDGGGLFVSVTVNISIIHMNRYPILNATVFSVSEAAGVGTPIGTLVGDDPDKPVALNFAIVSGNDAGLFAVDVFGQVTVAGLLDFDVQRQYVLVVSATDHGVLPADPTPLSVSNNLTINLLNVNNVAITRFGGTTAFATVGGDTVIVYGSHFGPLASSGYPPATVYATYGPTGVEFNATGCVVLPNINTALSCTTSPGSGAGLRWRVYVYANGINGDSAISAPTVTTSYLPPTVYALSDSTQSLSTVGNQSVTVFGLNFGPSAINVGVQYGASGRIYSASACSLVWVKSLPVAALGIANTSTVSYLTNQSNAQALVCTSAVGVGTSLSWQVTVTGQYSAWFTSDWSGLLSANASWSASSYLRPSVSAVVPGVPLLTTIGGDSVTLLGTSFGPASLDAFNGLVVQYGPASAPYTYTAVGCSVSVSFPHVNVTCTTSPGVGANHVWSVSVGGLTSAPSTQMTSYLPPVVTAVSGPGALDAKTDGGQLVYIQGSEFGAAADTAGLLLVTYGHDGLRFTAQLCTVITDYHTIQCSTAPGTGNDLVWYVSVGGQRSELYYANTSYGQPVVSFYNGTGTVQGDFTCDTGLIDCGSTDGNQTIDLNGLNFGAAALGNSIVVTYGPTGSELTASNCFIVQDHVRIRCATISAAGKGLTWSVVVDGQHSVSPTTAYDIPHVYNISGPGSVNASTYGGEVVILDGSDFGPAQPSYLEAVTYGPSGIEYTAVNCSVVNDSRIMCLTAPGIGAGLQWYVFIGGQQSQDIILSSYAAPAVTYWNYSSLNRLTDGGYGVGVNVTNVGVGQLGVNVFVEMAGLATSPAIISLSTLLAGGVAGFSASNRLIQHDDQLSFVVPPGRGEGLSIRIGVKHTTSTATRYSPPLVFDYNAPYITSLNTKVVTGGSTLSCRILDPLSGAAVSSTHSIFVVTLRGSNFGAPSGAGNGPAVLSNSNVVVWTTLQPDSSPAFQYTIPCFESWDQNLIAFGVAYKGSVVINTTSFGTSGQSFLQESNTQVFSYDFPTIGNLNSPSTAVLIRADGTSNVTIQGTGLFASGINTNVTIGGVSGGVPIDPSRVSMGIIAGAVPPAPTQWMTILVPPWQGVAVPLLIFKVYANGNAPGSQPYYVSIEAPVSTLGWGSSGISLAPIPNTASGQLPITARADGTTRVKLYGYNFGFNSSFIRFVNTFPASTSNFSRAFTNCLGNDTYIECTAPPGVGALDARNVSLQVVVVTPQLECDPVQQSEPPADPSTPVWNRCSVIVVGSQVQTSEPWQFAYEHPTVESITQNLSTAGGVLTVVGTNFGPSALGAPAVSLVNTVRSEVKQCVVTSLQSAPNATGFQSLQCTVGEGVGSAWVVSLSAGGQTAPLTTSFSYSPPSISDISPNTGVTDGGYNVTLTGLNFGGQYFGMFGTVYVTDDIPDGSGTALTVTAPVLDFNETSVTFTMPQEQGNKLVYVVVDGQSSNSISFQFAPPVIQLVSPEVIPTGGYTKAPFSLLTLNGTSFGVRGLSVEVSFPTYTYQLAPNADYLNTTNPNGTLMTYTRVLPSLNCTMSTPASVCVVTSQGHGVIQFYAPYGMGTNASVRVFLTSASTTVVSNFVTVWFMSPTVTAMSPNLADSRGQTITIYGNNFGWPTSANIPVVFVGGRPCINALLLPSTDINDFRPYVTCTTLEDVSGPKNLTITIGFQTVVLTPATTKLRTQCMANFFGGDGEFCDPCPQGAVCLGGLNDYSAPGWYNVSYNGRAGCTPHHLNDSVCWQTLPCDPMSACLGNNTCAAAYTDPAPFFRCSACSPRHYRVSSGCIPCPNNAWLLIVAFLVLAILLAFAGYLMNKKSVNIAFLSIGVDYFQVLAMFSRSNIPWPAGLQTIYRWMSAFNFNIDITAPECAIPHVGYKQKWFFMEVLPLAALIIFGLCHLAYYVHKRFILGRKSKLHSHLPALVGTSLVMMYYLYLNLTRSVFDVFNCQYLTPNLDGKQYLQVVFEPCSQPGGVHLTLLPFAVTGLAFYSVGYPLLVFAILYRNRDRVMEDQLLRAENRGNARLENPNCYDLRKMYHKLYYQYRPQYYYWTVVVLCRKFMIALTSLMFNRNPAFQLAMALLTLFICYSLQVRCTPYMSMSERSQVLQEHQRRVQAGVRQNMALEATLNSVRRGWKKAAGSAHMDKQLQLARQPVVSFFWNYNTVESVLLFSAVLVNLAGIMFQSGQLNTEGYETEKAFVTWVIVLVIVASIIYFFTVLFSEIYTMCTANSKKRLEKAMEEAKKQVELSRRKGMAMGEEKKGGGGDEAALNPLFVQMMRSTEEASDGSTLKSLIQGPPPSTGQWAGVVAGVEQLFATNQTLAEELAAIKKEVQTLKTITRSGSFRAPLPATGSSSPSSDHAAAARAPNRRLSTTTKRSFAPSSPLLHPAPQPPSPTINPLSLRLSET